MSTSRLCPFYVLVSYVILPVYLWSSKWVGLNPPPRSIPPHWSHWPPVTPPPPFPFLILMSPSSLLSYLQLHPYVCLPPPPPPLVLAAPAPASSRSRAVPTIVGGPMPPPPLCPLTEYQNRPHRNELRDRVVSPEDRCPCSHYPRFLGSSRQGEVQPLPVPPTAGHSPRQPPSYPALERV